MTSHCPFQLGYFASSAARAPPMVMVMATLMVAAATNTHATAPLLLAFMAVLPGLVFLIDRPLHNISRRCRLGPCDICRARIAAGYRAADFFDGWAGVSGCAACASQQDR